MLIARAPKQSVKAEQMKQQPDPKQAESKSTASDNEVLSTEEIANVSYRFPNNKGYRLPFVLSIIALVLGFLGQTLPFVGVVAGVAALLLRKVSKVPREKLYRPRVTTILAILGILFSLALSVYNPQPGTITVRIDAPDWKASYGTITVKVDGETTQGKHVSDELEVTPGEALELSDYATGSYTFSIDEGDLDLGDVLFETDSASEACELELEQDVDVTLSLTLVPQDGTLSLALTCPAECTFATDPVTVSVKGTLDTGDTYEDSFEMKFGDTIDLSDYDRGTYSFSVEPNSFTQDETVYAIAAKTCAYTKREDVSVTLSAVVDTVATQKLADQRAAEEAARAQAEAEAQAEAAAQAEAERQAQQQEAERAEQTVYITDTGSKYHRAGCRHLRHSSYPISLSDAQAQGYTPCGTCHPPAK